MNPMKKPLSLVVLGALVLTLSGAYGQTNPSAVALPFSLNSQSSATLPTGVAVHRFTSAPTSRTAATATGDLPNQGNSPTNNAGGWYHLGTDGIGILSSGTNPAGAVVVAINTSGLSTASVSWICKTIKNQASRDNSVALQYRVGTSGSFINVGTGSTYSSAGNADGHVSGLFTEALPAGALNQPVVQVRWIYWESVSTSGSRDKIAIDNISITGSAGSCVAPGGLSAAAVTEDEATLSWNAVAGALSYQYALTTSAAPPGSGTTIAGTTFPASGLTPSTVYYFHLRTTCSSGSSAWTTVSFVTEEEAGENPEFTFMTYNLLNYPGSDGSVREPSYRTVIGEVQPDILVVQEVSSSAGPGNFLNNVLNFSSTTYSQGTYINGPDSDNALFYKPSLFQFIDNTPIATALRNISQFRLVHLASGDTLIIYSVHLKAGDTAPEEALRGAETDSLRKVTNALAAGKFFLVCGDFNFYGASETGYQNLVTNGADADGKFYDMISMSGTWNNGSYAVHHTQSPRTTAFGGGATGGMDDRFDLILFSDAIVQPGGFDIVSSTYKAFGNDGAHYNQALNTPPYTLYTSTVAAALHDASDHLPVVVKLEHTGAMSARTATAEMSEPVPSDKIIVYPNPAYAGFYVQTITAFDAPEILSLIDGNGRVLKTLELSGASGEVIRFEITGLEPGTYYLQSNLLQKAHKIVVR
jgi:endonuclease/exonuclease/phosphatase family metal-dependent hydrolase